MNQPPTNSTDFSHVESLYDTRDSSLNYIVDMALDGDDNQQGIIRYGVRTQINSGGMKYIYKVEDYSTEREVAMACLRPEKAVECGESFLREARITASLEHPNIMPVYDIGVDAESNPYFTMKLTGGESLDQVIQGGQQEGSVPLFQLLTWFGSICEGISYAHSQDVVHLDLKPHNIQIGAFTEVLVCDWGLAKNISDTGEYSSDSPKSNVHEHWDLTLDGDIKGTPGFMAPEQVSIELGSRDKRTDVYALGGILYYMLSGKSPVRGSSLEKALEHTREGQISPFNVDVPPALKAVVFKALECSPDQRYQTVEELKAEVDAYINGYATLAEQAGLLRELVLLMKRHKIVTLFLLVLGLLGTAFVIHLKTSEQNAQRLLSLYQTEKEKSSELQLEALPALLKSSRSSLSGFNYEKCEAQLEKAFEYAPGNSDIIRLRAELLFYTQKFNAAAAMLSANTELANHPLFVLSKEFGQKKIDSARLNHNQFKELVGTLKMYRYQRQLMGYERQHYDSLAEFIESIQVFFQKLNPKQTALRCVLTQKNGRNSLDLSGNPRLKNLHISSLTSLPIHSINLEGLWLNNYNASKLATMPLEEINLAGDHAADLEFINDIPTLKKLTVTKGQYPEFTLDRLRKKISVISK